MKSGAGSAPTHPPAAHQPGRPQEQERPTVSTEPTSSTATTPTLRILTPSTTPEEVAAIVAVLSAVGGAGAPPRKRPARAWSAPQRGVRRTLPHGPGGWRASGLPG